MKTFTKLLTVSALMAGTMVIGMDSAEAGKRNKGPQGGSYYVKGSVGMTLENDEDYSRGNLNGEIDYDNDANYALAIGANLTHGFRTEFELSYRETDIDSISRNGVGGANASGELETYGMMLNAAYDFAPRSTFSPYVTAGAGFLHHDLSAGAVPALGFNNVSDSDWNFAYQAGGGLSIRLDRKLHLDTGYRYLASTDPDFGGVDTDYNVHEITTGLRYSF